MNRAGWLRVEELFQVAEQDAAVLERIAAAQRAELEEEIGGEGILNFGFWILNGRDCGVMIGDF